MSNTYRLAGVVTVKLLPKEVKLLADILQTIIALGGMRAEHSKFAIDLLNNLSKE